MKFKRSFKEFENIKEVEVPCHVVKSSFKES